MSLEKLYPGEYQLSVRRPGRTSFRAIDARFDVFEGEDRALAMIVADMEDERRPRAQVREEARDEDGEDD